MAKRTSSSMEVLLGLLTISQMSGYDLGLTIRTSVGHIWNESYGQIYPSLKRLATRGFVTSTTEHQEGKPDRHIYSITARGREHLAAWLAVEPQPEIPRNELLLKLFFGAQVPAQILIGYLDRMVERESSLVLRFACVADEEIAENQKYPDAPYWKMAARFGQLELESHLRWAEETLEELHKISQEEHQTAGATIKETSHGGE